MFRVARLQCVCCAWVISQVTPLWLLQHPLQGQLSLGSSPSGLSGCTGAAVAIDMPMTAVSVMAYLGVVLAGCVVVSIADSFSPAQVQTRCLLTWPSNHLWPAGSDQAMHGTSLSQAQQLMTSLQVTCIQAKVQRCVAAPHGNIGIVPARTGTSFS